MKITLLTSVVLLLSINVYSFSALPPEKPTLVVSIVVDNLSNEEIQKHSKHLSADGFLRLQNGGTIFSNATFPYTSKDEACDYASISTGTTPRYHGIVANEWYRPKSDDFQSCIEGDNTILVGSSSKEKGYNATKLMASTVGDELKISSMGKSKVYSISTNETAAILLAGHAADGVFWMDTKSGKWITSDYYMSWLPDWVNSFNRKNFAEFYLTQEWVLSLPSSAYHIDKERYDEKVFPIIVDEYKDTEAPYTILQSTPMGNMYVSDFASQLITKENLGKDENTDLLNINFSSITDNRINSQTHSIEKADFIIRLDKEIAKLVELLDKEVGSHQYVITLTSTRHKGLSIDEIERYRMPNGKFNPNRAKALLNSYLMALYGQGNWIINFSNEQIYLNKDLIEKSSLNFNDFQETVASFMEEFSGIKWTIPAYKLKYADFSDGCFMAMQESYFASRCGDVMISYSPGWAEEQRKENTCYTYNTRSALCMMYGWKIERKKVETEIFITTLAPTLSNIMKTSSPNCSSKKTSLNK